ncbi:MAG: RHS repeat-associated core domain-containing protein [Planctomycetota bacterium]
MKSQVGQLFTVGLFLVFPLALPARAEEYNKQNPIPESAAREIVGDTYFVDCANTIVECVDCCGNIEKRTADAKGYVTCPPGFTPRSEGLSTIDNLSFNHIHAAWDYKPSFKRSACTSCSGKEPFENLPLATFDLSRVHRYRDVSYESSFGPGVFSSYDAKLTLYALPDGSSAIDLFDPLSTGGLNRFIDGPYEHPFFDPENTLAHGSPMRILPQEPARDGVFRSFRTNSHHSITLLDENGQIVPDPLQAKTAILRSWSGKNFYFEIVTIAGVLRGRLTRMEDRNGYGIGIAYQFAAGSNLAGSEVNLWKIASVADSKGNTAQFTYAAKQVSGRWVVSRVDLPDGTIRTYTYKSGYLSAVAFPDGTKSAFTRTYEPVSRCTVMQYNDAGEEGTHRKKKVYLTTNFSWKKLLPDDFTPQSAQLVRMVTNGAGEVAYLNIPYADNTGAYIFHGNGALEHLWCGITNEYAKDDWKIARSDGAAWSFDSVQMNPEITSTWLSYPNQDYPGNWYRLQPAVAYDPDAKRRAFTYDETGNAIAIQTADGTDSYDYNEFGDVTRHTDKLGRISTRIYDEVGNLLEVRESVGTPEEIISERYAYYPAGDPNQHLLWKKTDANGNETEYQYDQFHRLIKIIDPADEPGTLRGETLYSYDPFGRLQTITDPEGRTTTYQYDARNRVIAITYSQYPTSAVETFTYGTGANANLLVAKTDRNGVKTTYQYDTAGRLIKETEAAGTSAASIRVISYRSGTDLVDTEITNGEKTAYNYDYRNRRVATTRYARQGFGLTQRDEYWRNQLAKETDPYGRSTYYLRDADMRVIRTVRELVPGGAGIVPNDETGSLGSPTAPYQARGQYLAALQRIPGANPHYIIEDTIYNAEGEIAAKIDPNGIRSEYRYDLRGRLVEQNDAVGTSIQAKTTFEYDAEGNRTAVNHPRTFDLADPLLCRTELVYTGRSLLKSKTEGAGSMFATTERYFYDFAGRLMKRIDGRGNAWDTINSCCATAQATIEPPCIVDVTGILQSPTAIHGTDKGGLPTYEAKVKKFPASAPGDDWYRNPPEYDGGDLFTLMETSVHYDARNRVDVQTVWLAPISQGVDCWRGPSGRGLRPGDAGTPEQYLATRYSYDDNLTDGTGLDAAYASKIALLGAGYFGADANGSAVQSTGPGGEKTVTIFDGVGRVVMTIDGEGNATITVHDIVEDGLVKAVVADPLNHANATWADGAGSTRQAQDAVGVVTTKSFDSNGNLVAETDGLGKTTVHVFDARNRRTSTTDRLGGITQFAYDANGNLIKITDAEGGETIYAHTFLNQLMRETFPDGGNRVYTYDLTGNLTSRLDQSGVLTTYTWDAANRMTSRNYPDGMNDTFQHDAARRMTSAGSARYANVATQSHDMANRVVLENLRINGTDYPTQYAYRAAVRETTITYPSGRAIRRIDNYNHLLSRLISSGKTIATFGYDAAHRETIRVLSNGIREDRTWRDDDLPQGIFAPGVVGFSYEFDANKRKTREGDAVVPHFSQNFGYDDENRLTSWSRDNGDTLPALKNQTWNLSLVGDWHSTAKDGIVEMRTHNPVHEITQINGQNIAHDLKGNLSSDPVAGQNYEWDVENHLTRATKTTGETLGTYRYDALGRRVGKTVGGTTITYALAGWQIAEEYENGALVRSCAYGNYIDEPVAMWKPSAEAYYYHHNHVYSVSAVTNKSGAVVERYGYDPYGKQTILAPDGVTPRVVSVVGNIWGFTGREIDPETGWMYFRNRYYSPTLGRFVSRDLIEYVDGMNLYAGYFMPNDFDPFGLSPEGGSAADVRITVQIVVYKGTGIFSVWKGLGWNVILDNCKDKSITETVTGETERQAVSMDWIYQPDDPKRPGEKESKSYNRSAQLKVEFCGGKCKRVTGAFVLNKVTTDYREWEIVATTSRKEKTKYSRKLIEHSIGTSSNPWNFQFDLGDKKATKTTYGPVSPFGNVTSPGVVKDDVSGLAKIEAPTTLDWKIENLTGYIRGK